MRTIPNETRFTRDVIHDAAHRLNELKEDEETNRDVSETLGWAPMAMNELAYSITPQIMALIEDMQEEGEDPEEAVAVALAGALFEGLMIGALCADVSWERTFNLAETS